MDVELKRKIAASLDTPSDTAADPEIARAIERDPKARDFARGLWALDKALRSWPVRARSEPDWEKLALAIDARIAATASESEVNAPGVAAARKEPDPAAFPEFDEPTHMMESKQVMSNEYDAELENLTALTRTSQGPGAMPVAPRSVAPSITDEVDDTSSGIVDIKKLAEVARSAASKPPPPVALATREEVVTVSVKDPVNDKVQAPSVGSDVVVLPPTRVLPSPRAPEPKKSYGAFWGAFGGIAISAAVAVFVTQSNSNLLSHPEAVSAPTAPAAQASPPAVPVAPSSAPQNQAPGGPIMPTVLAAPASATPTTLSVPSPAPVAAPSAGFASAERAAVSEAQDGPTAPGAEARLHARREHGGERGGQDSDLAVERRARAAQAAPSHVQAVIPTAPATPARPTPAPAVPTAQPTSPAVVVPAAPAPPRTPSPAGANANAPADNSIGRLLEQVAPAPSRTPTQQAVEAPVTELPVRPTRQMITAQMTPLNSAVRACMQGATGTVPVNLVIGSDGAVRSARVSGEHASDDVGTCISNVVQRAHFPPFTAPQASVLWPFVILPPR